MYFSEKKFMASYKVSFLLTDTLSYDVERVPAVQYNKK